jgi:membrane fusion protein (multidrug efflux system)
MKRSLFSVFLLVASMYVTSCGSETQSKPTSTDSAKAAIPVEVASVKTGSISAHYAGTASLEAENEATVVTRVAGIVQEIYVEEGDRVAPGQILAKLDDEKLKFEVERALTNLRKLEADLARSKELFDKKLVSVEAFQTAQFNYEQQKTVYEAAKLDLEFTSIKAPIGGIVSERMIKKGNLIPMNQPLYRITDFDPLLAMIFVPEKEMSKIRAGQPAKVSFDALPNATFSARVARISPVVDQKTGTFRVTVEVRDPSMQLKPGMFGRVQVIYETHANTLLIPKESVIKEDQQEHVFIVENGVAFRRQIVTGFIESGSVEVLKGIPSGARIVTLGQTSLRDSALVQVLN